MVNPLRGEVSVIVDGDGVPARLTLGALAELEDRLEVGGMVDVARRFETGGFSSRDVLAVLAAGLRAGGWAGTPEDLLNADIAGGPVGAARAAAELLARAFQAP